MTLQCLVSGWCLTMLLLGKNVPKTKQGGVGVSSGWVCVRGQGEVGELHGIQYGTSFGSSGWRDGRIVKRHNLHVRMQSTVQLTIIDSMVRTSDEYPNLLSKQLTSFDQYWGDSWIILCRGAGIARARGHGSCPDNAWGPSA